MLSILKRMSLFLLEDDINNRKKVLLGNKQTFYTTVGSLLVTIVGYLGITRNLWLIFIAIVLLVCTMVFFRLFGFALEHIENQEWQEQEQLKGENKELLKRLESSKSENERLSREKEYYISLWSETSLLSQAISKANYDRTTKGLYSKLTNSVIKLLKAYLPSIKEEDYAVHIYVYDGSTRLIRRVDAQSCVKTKQGAVENQARLVSDKSVREKYYVKAITHKRKKMFTLFDNNAIREAFYFDNEDEEIIKQYSQYIGMRFTSPEPNQIRIFVEVIAYNGLRFAEKADDLKTCANKIIAPFANPFSYVDWAAISEDSGLKGGAHHVK